MVKYTVVVGVVFGQVLPLAARSHHIEDGVDHLRMSNSFQRQQWLDNPLLFVAHITSVNSFLVR